MRLNGIRRKIAHNNHLFNGRYIDPKALFVCCYDIIPNISYISDIDVNAAYQHLQARITHQINDVFEFSQLNRETGNMEFHVKFILLGNRRLIEVGNDYISIFHARDTAAWVFETLGELARFALADKNDRRIGFATGQAVSN